MPKANSYPSTWSDADVATLRAGVAEGLSAAAIMRTIGCRHSRNAVIGKVLRLGLALAGKPGSNTHRVRSVNAGYDPEASIERRREAAERAVDAKYAKRQVEQVEAESFIGITGNFPVEGCCCYVIGSLKTLKACGHPTARNKRGKMTPYCDYHRSIVYQAPMTKGNEPSIAIRSLPQSV